MPKPRHAKVWNEDLVAAMHHRANLAGERGNLSKMSQWQRAAEALEGVAKDIYQFSNGRIMNLPLEHKRHFSKTARQECEWIVRGERDVYEVPPRASQKRKRRSPADNDKDNEEEDAKVSSNDAVWNLERMAAKRGRDLEKDDDEEMAMAMAISASRSQAAAGGAAAAALTEFPLGGSAVRGSESGVDESGTYDHAYLRRMVRRGGGYALLLAFYHHARADRPFLYKEELLRAAQPYSDEVMLPNYFAGTSMTAGWNSIKSLETHKLVHRTSHFQSRKCQFGFRGGPKDQFSVTDEGRRFVAAMISKWPEAAYPHSSSSSSSSVSGLAGRTPTTAPRRAAAGVGGATTAPSTCRRPVGKSRRCQEDEKELLSWLETVVSRPGQVKEFHVSKDRRQHLHNLCDYLGQTNQYQLSHHSRANGKRTATRTLRIVYEGPGAGTPGVRLNCDTAEGLQGMDEDEDEPLSTAVEGFGAASLGAATGEGQRLGGKATFAATSSRLAALEAAEKRRRLQDVERKRAPVLWTPTASATNPTAASLAPPFAKCAEPTLFDDDDDDDDMKTAIQASLSPAKETRVDSEDEEFKQAMALSLSETNGGTTHSTARGAYKTDVEHASTTTTNDDDDDNADAEDLDVERNALAARAPIGGGIVIVDSRERVTNKRPRELYDGVQKHVERISRRFGASRSSSDGWLVERKALAVGDFAWIVQQHVANCIVERKKIGDLVGRSAEPGGFAHKEQMDRIRRIANNNSNLATRGFLLLEGKFSQAFRSVVHDEGDVAGERIDTPEAIYQLAVRLFVYGWKAVQIIHTIDHEATCRYVAVLSAVVARLGQPLQPPMTFQEYNQRYKPGNRNDARAQFNDQLFLGLCNQNQSRQAARCAADAVTSRFETLDELMLEYHQCHDKTACRALLVPFLRQYFLHHEEEEEATRPSTRDMYRWSSEIHEICAKEAGTTTTNKISTGEPEREQERRRVCMGGPLSQKVTADSVVCIRDETIARGMTPTTETFHWGIFSVSDGTHHSNMFRVVVVPGSQLLDYVKSVFDPSQSDVEVAMAATRILSDDLDTCFPQRRATQDLVLLDGVAAENRRYQRGNRSNDLPSGMVQRLCDLLELSVAILQVQGVTRHLLSIHETQSTQDILQALVEILHKEAFLYHGTTSPCSAAQQGTAQEEENGKTDKDSSKRCKVPSSTQATTLCSSAGLVQDDSTNHVAASEKNEETPKVVELLEDSYVDLSESQPEEKSEATCPDQPVEEIVDLANDSQDSVVVVT